MSSDSPEVEQQDEVVSEEVDSPPPEPSPEEQQANLLRDFLTHFASTVDKTEREAKLRATKAGFFLEESLFDSVVTVFQSWFQDQVSGGSKLTTDKASKKLFETEPPLQYYVLEGKHSMVGYVIPVEMKHPHKSGVQLYHGQPLEALNYLHPRDPLLENLEGVKSSLGKSGLEFRFVVGKRDYLVAMPQLQEFAHVARGSKRVCRDYPRLEASLREALKVLPSLVGKARTNRSKMPLLIPGRFRSEKDLIFLCVGTFVFVVRKSGEWVFTYDLKGKNRHQLITSEYDYIRRMRKPPRVDGLEIVKNPKARFLANFKLQGQKYQLLPKAFGDFVEQAPTSPELCEKFAPFFTIFDCVRSCAELFMQSSIVDSRDMGKYLKDKRYKDVKYLRVSKGFVFVVNKKQVVLDCFHMSQGGKRKRKGKAPAAKQAESRV